MTSASKTVSGPLTLPLAAVVAVCVAIAVGIVYWSSGEEVFFVANLLMLLTEGGLALTVFVAAGALAWPIARRLGGPGTPWALRAATACGLGLWFLSILVLAVGTVSYDLLKPRLWWPVIVLGMVLAGWFVHKRAAAIRLPSRIGVRELVWAAAAVAGGLWLAGALHAPGLIGLEDTYDVLEYHLQLPREFFTAQHIVRTPHNVYGHFPLGVEMLFLLGMILRGGAYEGMYLANLLHGLFGLLAVWAVAACLREQPLRGRLAGAMLACMPLGLGLSWMAMVELAQVFYLAAALLWLRQWLKDGQWTAAVGLGLMLGGSCGVKYLSVGLAAGPVLAAMAAMGLRRRRKELWHVLPGGAACLVLFLPWLARNYVRTGNPVFPLATTMLGRGHWDQESQQRWVDGHGPAVQPPVPVPPGWQRPGPLPGRAEMFYRNFLASGAFGPTLLLLAAAAAAALVAARRAGQDWDWAMLIVLAVQLAVWTACTHGMPTRFLAPAMVPLVLLAGGLLARMGGEDGDTNGGASPVSPLSAAIMWGLFLLTVALGLFTSVWLYVRTDGMNGKNVVLEGGAVAKGFVPFRYAYGLPSGRHILLIGEARGFYFPSNTTYATAFDEHPLVRLVRQGREPRQIVQALRGMGVSHLWVDWNEIVRLASTYGYPPELTGDLLLRLRNNQPPQLDILERLRPHGLTLLHHVVQTGNENMPTTAATTMPTEPWPLASIYVIEE